MLTCTHGLQILHSLVYVDVFVEKRFFGWLSATNVCKSIHTAPLNDSFGLERISSGRRDEFFIS